MIVDFSSAFFIKVTLPPTKIFLPNADNMKKTLRLILKHYQKTFLITTFLILLFYGRGYSQTIATFAGTGTAGSLGDGGPATSAQLHNPFGMCYDKSGNILIADYSNFKIRKIDGSGNITAIAGTGLNASFGNGGPATSAGLLSHDVAVNSVGDIFIDDFAEIRKIDHTTGIITSYAGTGTAGFSGDGGPATSAQIANVLLSIAFDAADNLYIAEFGSSRIRVVNAQTGIISTFAGTGIDGSSGDGGLATSAKLGFPASLFVQGSTLYIGDIDSYNIRTIDLTTNIISTLTSTNFVSSTNVGFITYAPGDLAVDNSGNVYVAGGDNQLVVKFSNGTHTVLAGTVSAGSGTAGFNGDGGLGTNAQLHGVYGILLGGSGELYVSDYLNNRIRILKAQQTITFNTLPTKTNGDPSFTLNATASSGLTVTYTSSNASVATVSGNTVIIVGQGASTITANQAGNTIFDAAASVARTLTVKGSQGITFTALATMKVGDAPFSLGATADSGLPVTYASSNTSVATVSGSTLTVVGTGTSTITASQAGNASFNAATDVTQIVTVNKGDQSISFAALPAKKYGDVPFSPATASSGLAISYTSSNLNVATVSGNTVTIVGLGTSTITASQPGDTNYNAASDIAQTLTVNKGDQTIAFATLATKKFGDVPFTLGAVSSSGLAISYTSSNTGIATVSGNIITIVGAGTSTITASQAGDTNFGAGADVTQIFTVNKAGQTITFATLTAKKFGDVPFTLGATADSGLPITYSSSNKSVATVSGNTLTIVGLGTSTITASQAGDANYKAATDVTQTLTVTKKTDQTITFSALPTKNQGDAAFTLSANSSSGLVVTYSIVSGPATISGSTLALTGAGTVLVKASQTGDANYNAAVDVTQSFCVNPSKPSISLSLTDPSNSVLTSSNAQGNQWFLNGASINNATSSTYAASAVGSYAVQTTIGSCTSAMSDAQVLVVTAIEPEQASNGLQCYPNPTDSKVTIQYSNTEPVHGLEITDMTGRVLRIGSTELLNTPLSTEGYEAGLYLVRIKTGSHVLMGKFLKK